MKKRSVLTLLAGGFLLQAGLMADQSNNGTAGVAAPFLKLPASPRIAAMGEAFVAIADDSNSNQVNPAGLSQIESRQVSLMHNAWFQGISDEHLAYAQKISDRGGIGASVDYLNFGSVDKYSIDSNGNLVANGSLNPSAYHVDIAYGQSIGNFSLGANAKFLSQNIDTYSATGFGVDLGALWKMAGSPFSLGAAVQNIGGQVSGFSLPLNVKAGGAYAFEFGQGNERLNLAADLNLPTADASSTSFSLGGEFWYHSLLALRAGYKVANRGSLNGISGLNAGLGARYHWVEFDYALVTLGDLGTGNEFAFSVSF